MEWNTELPEKDGKYVVKTQSSYGPNGVVTHDNVLQSTLSTNTKGQRHWTFKNQKFIAYLKE